MFVAMLAAVAATAAPPADTKAPTPPPIVKIERVESKTPVSAATKAANEAAQAAMFAEMAVKALDRVLPPQPDPEPARLALARSTMDGFMPAGSYNRMVDVLSDNLMTGVYEHLMGMTGTELSNAVGMPVATGPDAALTLRQQASKGDPMFDARMKAYAGAMRDEMKKSMTVMEPKMREGMARAMARRFSAPQLTDLNKFFATPTGRAFGQDMMLLWVDGDVYRGMFAAMPELMRTMPESAKRFEAIEKQYPWPKKPEVKKDAPAAKKPAPKK